MADTKGNLRIAPDEVALPVGRFVFSINTKNFPQDITHFEKFVSTEKFRVKGFSRRNREAGLGAPIIAVEKKARAPECWSFILPMTTLRLSLATKRFLWSVISLRNSSTASISLTSGGSGSTSFYMGMDILRPLPFVKRVIFISTPHRSSYLSKNWVRTFVLKVISLPQSVIQSTASLVEIFANVSISEAHVQQYINRTSLDVMSPNNPIMQTMANIPLDKGITGHSIIAIKGGATPPKGDDGVVEYSSAHVDYVESEFIVRSSHSCQGHPLVIEEVRRILLEHLEKAPVIAR